MNVGFFTVYRLDPQHYVLADKLVRSVRSAMPGVEVVQFTDESSPAVLGVDRVRRRPPGKMLERRMEHYAECEGEWLLVDTDVLVRQDVRDVFADGVFDVALADRSWPHLPQKEDVLATMPFNSGVMFSRSPDFWRSVLAIWREAGKNDWMSEQRAVYEAVRSGRHRVKILPGMKYNYPPKGPKDPLDGVAIAHFKGERKQWMRRD